MKVRHDVDATTLAKRKAVGAALSLLVLAGAASATAPVDVGLKTLHDGGGCCMREVK